MFRRRYYHFTLMISKPKYNDGLAADKLYESGCDDCLFGVYNGEYIVTFDRKAFTMKRAIKSAIKDVKKSGIGSIVLQVIFGELKNYTPSGKLFKI